VSGAPEEKARSKRTVFGCGRRAPIYGRHFRARRSKICYKTKKVERYRSILQKHTPNRDANFLSRGGKSAAISITSFTATRVGVSEMNIGGELQKYGRRIRASRRRCILA
jgi:hypothetical protein